MQATSYVSTEKNLEVVEVTLIKKSILKCDHGIRKFLSWYFLAFTLRYFNRLHVHEDNCMNFVFFSPQCPAEQLALIFQGIWINLMLLYVGLSVVSITINLCAQSLVAQLKKTGLYLKIIELFSSHGDSVEKNSARAQGEETADVEDHCRGQGESIAMSDLEERRKTDIEEDHQAAKLKIVRDADGKSYGTLNE